MSGELELLLGELIGLVLLIAFLWGAFGKPAFRENRKRTEEEQADELNKYWLKKGVKAG